MIRVVRQRDTYAASIEFLRALGAVHVRHSDRAFLDHLIGTARLLETWGADDDVCRAGLFHSIYGTESFEEPLLSFDERARVIEQIGERAERLAYVFCRFEPHSLFRAIQGGEPYFVDLLEGAGTLPITRRELVDLLAIFWANKREQLPTFALSAEGKRLTLSALELCRPFLPEIAFVETWRSFDETPTED